MLNKKQRVILKNSIVTLLLVFCHYPIIAQETTLIKTSSLVANKIDEIFEEYNNQDTPGVAIGFIQNGKMIFSKGYGMADLEHQIPISETSVFSLASVSKQFTVFAILLLQRHGKLSLDDDIKKYLPDFGDYGQTITIRMLANHTSGIRGHLWLLGQKGYITDNVITSTDVHQVIYQQKELNFNPGTEFSYSNSGYFLMAEIVEKVTGKSFAEYIDENILKPLEMNDSFVMDNYHRIIPNRANSYEMENGYFVNAPANYSYTGSTNLYTTLNDLSKWVLNFKYPTVGDKTIFKQMNTLSKLENGKTFGYALGQFNRSFNGLSLIDHSGGDAGYRTYLGRFPQQNSAVMVLSNNNTINAESKGLETAEVFLQSFYKRNQNTPSKPEKSKKIPISRLKKYEGRFLDTVNYTVRNIFVRRDTLIYSRQEQNGRETPLYPISENTFQLGFNKNVFVQFNYKKQSSCKVLVDGKIVESYYEPKSYSIKKMSEFEGMYYSNELDTTYELKVKNETLNVFHPKIGSIKLELIKTDGFLSSGWQFRSLEIERNTNGEITAFRISSDRARNVKFEKTTQN